MAIALANTCAIGYGFIDKKFAEKACQVLKIEPQCLIKSKQIQKFHDKATKLITYAIYPILIVAIYIESMVSLFITKLENYHMIFS